MLRPNRLSQPLHWRQPRMIFVNSLSDLFHPLVPDHFVRQVWDVMARADWHIFQVLTKRPERMAALVPDLPRLPWLGVSIETDRWVGRADHLRATPAAVRFMPNRCSARCRRWTSPGSTG